MNKKRLIIGVSILLGVLILAVASAIYAGECLEVELSNMTSLDNVVYDVVGNEFNLTGLTITLNETIASICTVPNYKPDSFTIIFIDNSTKEIIKEVPVYRGGGTKDLDRNITVEKEVEKIVYINQTEEPEPIEPEEEEKFLWVYMLCSFITGIVLTLFFKLFKKSKGEKKNEK